MDEAVARGRRRSPQSGDAVLLSPACASFDWYPDGGYPARGDDFRRLVDRAAAGHFARQGRDMSTATIDRSATGAGRQLERAAALRRHPTARTPVRARSAADRRLLRDRAVVAVFVMLGLVMVLSASSIQQFHQGYSPWRMFNRQAIWAVFGAVALWIVRCACRTTSGGGWSCPG